MGNLDGCPYGGISTGGHWIWNPNTAATATSTASKMSVISATGIEPAADLRKALAERKRASLVPLVVLLDTDAEGAAGFRTPCASTRVGGARDGRRLSCCHNTRLGACCRQPPFRH